MTAPPFPVVGAVAPLASALVLWAVTGSNIALVGAVIAPTMVVANFLDSRRRAHAADRDRTASAARDEAIRREVERAAARQRVAEANLLHPSVSDIAESPEWVPPLSGNSTVRVGHLADGSPWLVSLEGGVAIDGSGSAADSVWSSAVFHARAQLGEPAGSEHDLVWPSGSRLARGRPHDVARTIRCGGDRVESLAERGHLPRSGEWEVDATRRAREVTDRIFGARESLSFSDRARCNRGIGLAGSRPVVLDLTSDTPHVLIAGRTGSGKSLALTALLVDWSERHPPDALTVVGVDFKGGATLRRLESLANFAAILTDLDIGVVPRFLAALTAEMRRREVTFAAQRAGRIEDATGVPRLAVVIDEAHEFVRRHPEAHDVLADVARRGRSLGVHLILAVQQPTALRDSVLANVAVRVALAGNTPFEVAQVLGRPVGAVPAPGHALVTVGDGVLTDVEIRVVHDSDLEGREGASRPHPPWCAPLAWPLASENRDGFGMLDDTALATQRPAVWTPADGDVLVIGARCSGKTTALTRLVTGLTATWVREGSDLDETLTSIVVVDGIDRMLSELSPREATEFLERLARCRAASPRPTFLYSAATPVPRLTGPIANLLTLHLATLDEHRAAGAHSSTWSRSAPPGTGEWNGVPVTVYASADSTVTDSMP